MSSATHWSTAAQTRSGRCAVCKTVYRWTGKPILGQAKCIEDGTTLTARGRAPAGQRIREVEGEWLR